MAVTRRPMRLVAGLRRRRRTASWLVFPAFLVAGGLGGALLGSLRDLLSAGPFELASVDRDEDVYGRKLRIVMRDGQSIGDAMVAEGLAHHWRGHQEDWC